MSWPICRSTELALVLATALPLAFGALGCTSEGAREYAVTLTDASALTCRVEASAAFDEHLAAARISERENSYAAYRAAVPAEPEGHRFFLLAEETRVSAWFEASLGASPPAGTGAVFEGPAQDGFVEVAHSVTGHVTSASGAVVAGGPVVLERAVLTLTLVDLEARGRVQVSESSYGLGAASDPPDTHLVCTRDVHVRGAELP
jgi:hypothetical protein